MNTLFDVRYNDGTIIEGLTFEESEKLFYKALTTDNTCSVYPQHTTEHFSPR